jgi:hypothetical protein
MHNKDVLNNDNIIFFMRKITSPHFNENHMHKKPVLNNDNINLLIRKINSPHFNKNYSLKNRHIEQ